MDLTTQGLIEDIKLNALLPDGMFENADLISFINDAYFSDIVSFIMRHQEDFFVTYTDFEPASSIAIPSDAIAMKLKDVQIKRDNNIFYNLPRLSMGEITKTTGNWNRQNGFYIQDNSVVFYPNAQTNTVRLVYYKRPCYLMDSTPDTTVTAASAFQVLSKNNLVINTNINPLSVTGAGVNWNFTLSKGYQPFDTETIVLAAGPAGSQFTAPDAATAAKITVGDGLCPVGSSIFPKLPYEARDVLTTGAVVKAMIAMKDKDGYAIAQEQLKEVKAAVSSLISPRIDNEVKKIVNNGALWSKMGTKGWRR